MAEIEAHPGAPASTELDGSRWDLRRIAVLVGAGCAALTVALVGWFLGSASLTAVEPNDLFVSCGPALFGRPDPLPDALCADAYFPLPAASVLLITVGVLGAVLCLGLLIRSATSSARLA
jgi:hypothetical protein